MELINLYIQWLDALHFDPNVVWFCFQVVVFFFSSLSSAVVIQIIKCSIVPILAVLAYFYWDQLVSLLSNYKWSNMLQRNSKIH